MFSSGTRGSRRDRARGQARIRRWCMDTLARPLPPPHATGGCSVAPQGAKFTRLIQHQLIILQPRLLLSLLLIWRQWDSLPQNLGHFLMTCQGRMSQRCMKRHGGGNALSLELGSGVCSHSSERVSLCHPMSLNAL